MGIDSTPPQAAEKSNYSADTPSSPIASFRFDNAKRRRQENHPRQRWLTPAYILEPIRQLLGGIELDPCTEPDNPIEADRFYTPPQDGAVLPWDARSVFVNPPYGEARERWVERAIIEGRRRKVVLLIPAATDTFTCQRALGACRSVVFVRARVRFGDVRANGRHEAASHGSAIFGFGVDVRSLTSLGIPMARSFEIIHMSEERTSSPNQGRAET